MMTKKVTDNSVGLIKLRELLDNQHGLYRLADIINWDWLIEHYGPYYCENNGRPSIPIRVIVGLHYLKYLEDESDKSVVEKFCENPYWQYFCGYETFQHRLPCDPSNLSRWRNKVGEKAIERMLEETLNVAKREALLKSIHCQSLNVDTTVQEKAIAFPTDSKLRHTAREKLVKASKERNIPLRQSYVRKSKKSLIMQGRYSHARQMKRANKERKQLNNYLGRVIRDIERKAPSPDAELSELLDLSKRVHHQKKTDKNKLYSLWAPEVECIAKGKSHKKYEYGCKVSVATTCKDPWVVSVAAVHGNPYDGQTLQAAINQAEENTGVRARKAFVDQGYKGKDYHPDDVDVYVTGRRGLKGTLKKLLRGRAGIEPVIGHIKNEHKMDKSQLHGKKGDCINAILAGCAFNLNKLLRLLKPQNHTALAV